jgi:hypothetical protein
VFVGFMGGVGVGGGVAGGGSPVFVFVELDTIHINHSPSQLVWF